MSSPVPASLRIAVVIPCFRVTRQIGEVLARIGPEVARIYCVDDGCPERSGVFIHNHSQDPRVVVIERGENGGVGAATLTGYRRALADGFDIVVKLDGDGQMDPRLIPAFVGPIVRAEADYTKGNRFFNREDMHNMPLVRLVGNGLLSLLTKTSSGYWHLFDPTNGYTAIHAAVLRELPLDKVATDYFFESDMLFRLYLLRAAVVDVPMKALYGEETSHLKIRRVIVPYLTGNLRNVGKRIIYEYLLRDFNAASLELAAGAALVAAGSVFGGYHWCRSVLLGAPASAGTVMLSAMPVLVGLQLLLSAFHYDVGSVPRRAIHRDLLGAEAESDHAGAVPNVDVHSQLAPVETCAHERNSGAA